MEFSSFPNATDNKIISALPDDERRELLRHAKPVVCESGDILAEPGAATTYAYFPLDALITLQSVVQDGKTVELAMVGGDGVTGIPFVLDLDATWYRTVVQIPGSLLRVEANVLKEMFDADGALSRRLLRYMHALYAQISQVGVCNRLHTMDERFCTWLLMVHDRVGRDRLPLTHEKIAHTLGFRRSGVTVAAGMLQREEVISYGRGSLHIIDRRKLERRACECYSIMARETERQIAA